MHLPVPFCLSSKRPLAFLACLALSTLAAPAVVLVSSDFDTGYTGGGTSLNGQSGGGDVNLAGTYVSNTSNLAVNVVDSINTNNLTYNVSGGGTIDGGSHAVRVSTSNSNSGGIGYTRSLTSNFGGQTIYLRVVVQSSNPFGSSYVQFRLSTTGGANTVVGLADGFTTAPVGATSINGTTLKTSGTMTSPAPNLIVASFNWNSATSQYESASLWLNPTATSQGTPNVNQAIAGFNPTFNSIGLNILNQPNDRTYAFDSFMVATTWAEVVPQVPEPGALSLLAAGLFAILPFRRRARSSRS